MRPASMCGSLAASSPAPALPDTAAAASLKREVEAQLDVARKLIVECCYHRRDEELAELDDVVADRRRFTDLLPRSDLLNMSYLMLRY